MRILLIGNHQKSTALAGALSQCTNLEVTQCSDNGQALAELRRNASVYSWILVETDADPPTQSFKLADRIHALATDIPISFISHSNGLQANRSRPQLCGMVNHPDGTQTLRCANHIMQNVPRAALAHTTEYNLDDVFVFEYHAPCQKTA